MRRVSGTWHPAQRGSRLVAETRANRGDHVTAGGQDAEKREPPRIDNGPPIDEHLELAVSTALHLHVGAKLASQFRRHTDGVQSRHSIGAVTDGDTGHGCLQ